MNAGPATTRQEGSASSYNKSQVNIKWVFLTLLCETLAQNKVLGLHNTVVRQPTDTSLRKIHAGRVGEERESEQASLRPAEVSFSNAEFEDGFIYVYKMPSEFTDDLTQLPVRWHPSQYDYDQVLHRHLLQSKVRTQDPTQAQLFSIPVYLGRHFNWFWQRYSAPDDVWDLQKECHTSHTPIECFWDKWNRAKEASSNIVRKALLHVRKHHPYWDKWDGADHFMVFSYDHGRCDMAPGLQHEEFGRMFAIQSYGDIMSVNDKNIPPLIQRWRENDYTWAGPKSWACFRPEADILVPMYFSSPEDTIVSPYAGQRDITLLMRFVYQAGDGKNLVEHFGHRLRYELIEEWKANPLEGSEQGLASPEETLNDMAHSVFCAAPPGQTQDSVRVFRAIIKGCIPVTFYRGNDRPFERHLKVPWDAFSVNMQPDDYDRMNMVLQSILDNPKWLESLQSALAAVQRQFVWDPRVQDGVLGSIERELSFRATSLPTLGST